MFLPQLGQMFLPHNSRRYSRSDLAIVARVRLVSEERSLSFFQRFQQWLPSAEGIPSPAEVGFQRVNSSLKPARNFNVDWYNEDLRHSPTPSLLCGCFP
jgi:hypothetical protein